MVNERKTEDRTPRAAGYVQPAEWTPHRTCYSAWPAHEYAWGPALREAQHEFVHFVRAFVSDPAQEPLTLLVDAEHMSEAREALSGFGDRVRFECLPYGDVWLRDTGPVFLKGPSGIATVRFRFNGWGEKFIYLHDAALATRLAERHVGPAFAFDFVLEGGAIEVDGAGSCLTTRSCLLNPNRDPNPNERVSEMRLRDAFGLRQVIWLDRGLENDHTDGHIDNIARFVAKGTVVCMQAHDADDPNRDTLAAIETRLRGARDAHGEALKVVMIPSPGRVIAADGGIAPASYMNFYIGNALVLMPTFSTRWDEPAREALQALFPDRRVIGCSARALLEGGGTFHCMTQQEPSA
ncbi:MAG TPA: agmatine deiminase family protein [Polyangiales bacterium]|nr:agmatine deiminase family protein [Polyangiales bacterium]